MCECVVCECVCVLGVCTTHCSLVEDSHVYSSLVLATTAVDLTHRERTATIETTQYKNIK